MEAVVKPISESKQRKSIGETAKREKEQTKKVTRVTVVNPRQIDWPDVDEASLLDLRTFIERSMVVMNFPARKIPLTHIRKIDKDKRRQFRQQWRSQQVIDLGFDMQNYVQLRSSIAIGVNCVSRTLELGELAGVIIEKDVSPSIITKILVPACIGKDVPIIAIHGLNEIFMKVAKLRCIAVGFKKCCDKISHQFHPSLEMVKNLGKKYLEVPNPLEHQPKISPETTYLGTPGGSSDGPPTSHPETEERLQQTQPPKGVKRKKRLSNFQTPKIRKVESEVKVTKKKTSKVK